MSTQKDNLPDPVMWDFKATSLKPEISKMTRRGDKPQAVPCVYYTTEAWHTIQYLVHKCSAEVGWVGLVEKYGDNDYLITDIFVPEQEVSGVTTEIEDDAMTKLTLHLIDQGLDPGQLIYWGHSHVNMGVGPSGQDERQLAEYIEHCPVFIRGIYNKKGEAKVDVFHRDEQVVYQCVDQLPLHDLIDHELARELDAVIKANVKPRTYNFSKGKPHNPNFTPSTKSWEIDKKGEWNFTGTKALPVTLDSDYAFGGAYGCY